MRYLLLVTLLVLTSCGKNDAFTAKRIDNSKEQYAAIEERIKPFSVVNIAGATVVAAANALPGEAKYAACGACHGANGGGGVGPALVGQTADYLIGRLNAYRAGETVGSQSNLMWAQAGMLSDTDITDLVEYIETL